MAESHSLPPIPRRPATTAANLPRSPLFIGLTGCTNESDFEDVFNEFLAIVCDPLNEMPGMTFNRLYLYVETGKR